MFCQYDDHQVLRFVVIGETAALDVVVAVMHTYPPQMLMYVCNTYEISLGFCAFVAFCVMCGYLFCVLTVVTVPCLPQPTQLRVLGCCKEQ
jgi:hypothetical protein